MMINLIMIHRLSIPLHQASNFTFNLQMRLVDSFSLKVARQLKPGREIDISFDLSMLSNEIPLVEIYYSNIDISSVSSEDS